MTLANFPKDPKLGDTCKPYEEGYSSRSTYVWAACSKCGKERWVPRTGEREPRYKTCQPCSIKSGSEHHAWKKSWVSRGYTWVHLEPNSLFQSMLTVGKTSIQEHRLVMAEHLGRPLEPWEIVHHLDGNKTNNKIENLELLPDHTKHRALTAVQEYIRHLESKIQELSKRLSKYEEV